MEQKISFKDLIVWQRAMQVAEEVYTLSKLLPKEENYSLTSQIRRSAVSIPSNIAEGNKRGTKKDYCQFLKIANGPSAELETQLILLEKIYPEISVKKAFELLTETQKMLTIIIRKLES